MFCQKCGAPSETRVCPNCAANARPNTQPSAPSEGILPLIQKYWHFVLAGLGIVLLVFGILNLFSVFEINMTVTDLDSEYIAVSDAAELMELANSTVAPIQIGNVCFGLFCIFAALVGILYFLKVFKNMPFYDNKIFKTLVVGRKNKTPAGAMSGMIIGGTLIQFLMYMLCTLSRNGKVVITFGIHWTSWLLFAVCILLLIANKVVMGKKEQ